MEESEKAGSRQESNPGKWRKVKRPAVARSRTQDTSDLRRLCSAPEPRQPDDHHPSHTCGTECLRGSRDETILRH